MRHLLPEQVRAVRDAGARDVLGEMVAADAGQELPATLVRAMRTTRDAFRALLVDGFPRHQDVRTGRPLPGETVAGLLALYAGTLAPEQAGPMTGARPGVRR
ncbi:hypothetical protein [Pseudofrankia inefficax]|uniref:hypothetical protein n=1 Tax=Pseudofrankia inefficax (strain DSM 45817 / CECT 9037 / DDB 130130 / EuI1c) TaxID=298654 RepID=UPI0001BF9827|nr:hypothetical protein [Pseudofrankia inefficax]